MSRHYRRPVRTAVALAAASPLALLISSTPASAAGVVTTHETPKQILTSAEAATLSATSVSLTEHLDENGTELVENLSGRFPTYERISLSAAANSETYVIRGGTVYFEASADFWAQMFQVSLASGEQYAGQWFKTTATDHLLGGSITSVNPKVLERDIFVELDKIESAKNVTVREASVAGQPAIRIAVGAESIYVAATGKPYLLRFTGGTKTDSAAFELHDFDAPIHVVLPATSQNLDAAVAAAQALTVTTTTAPPS